MPASQSAFVVFAGLSLAAAWNGFAANNTLPRSLGFHCLALALLFSARRQPARLKIPAALLLLAASVALPLASRPNPRDWPQVADALAALLVIVSTIHSRLSRRLILHAIVTLTLSGCLVGLLQQYWPLDWNAATLPAGLFASRSTAAALAVFISPLCLVTLSKRRLLLFAALALLMAFVVSIRARIAYVSLALTVLLALWRLQKVRLVLLASALVGLVIALTLTPGPRLHWNSSTPYADSLNSIAQLAVGDRLWMWKETLKMTASQFLLGTGPGSFELSFGAQASQVPDTLQQMRIESPHNEPLRLLAEYGLLGVLGLTLVFWIGKKKLQRKASDVTFAIRASLATLCLASLTGKTFVEVPTLLVTCLLIGLLLRATPRRFPKGGGVLAAALALLVVGYIDNVSIHESSALKEAISAVAAQNPTQALKVVEGKLSDSHSFERWLWRVEWLRDAGDTSRCQVALESARQQFGNQTLLLEMRCR